MFIGDRISMSDGFTHLKDRYTQRKKPVPLAVNACLLSEAFGLSITKMANMSDINFNLLRATREDCIRIDTLCTVNDFAANHIHSLAIFKLWDLYQSQRLTL